MFSALPQTSKINVGDFFFIVTALNYRLSKKNIDQYKYCLIIKSPN